MAQVWWVRNIDNLLLIISRIYKQTGEHSNHPVFIFSVSDIMREKDQFWRSSVAPDQGQVAQGFCLRLNYNTFPTSDKKSFWLVSTKSMMMMMVNKAMIACQKDAMSTWFSSCWLYLPCSLLAWVTDSCNFLQFLQFFCKFHDPLESIDGVWFIWVY